MLTAALFSTAFVVQWRPQAAPVCRSGVSAVTMFGEFMKKRPGDENSFVQTEMRGAVRSPPAPDFLPFPWLRTQRSPPGTMR